MSTVKISQLQELTSLNSNTANTIFVGVDIPSGITAKFSATTLARNLYSNNQLVVGNYVVTYPNTVAMFANSSNNYVQTIIENTSDRGSADFIAQANVSTDTSNYIDLGFTGSKYSNTSPFNSLGTVTEPLSGYLYVQGDGISTGNFALGTTANNTEVRVFVAGINSGDVKTKFTKDSVVLTNGTKLTFTDGTSQNTAASPASYSQAAFNKANNALANTSGTFAGNLTVTGNIAVLGTTSSTGPISTGNLIVNGTSTLTGNVIMNAATYMTGAVTVNSTMLLANSLFTATDAALTISATSTYAVPSNDGYMIHTSGKNGVPSRIVADSYGTGAYSVYAGRSARGTVTAPSALQANDVITRIASNGYGTTKYQTLGVGRIDFVANENYTDANTGSRIEFWNCPTGSNTLNKIATFNGDSVAFTGAVNPQKGFQYTPNNITTVATSYTVDFIRDSMVRMSVNDNMNITLQNFVAGKVVEVWITNSAAQNKTITHGCFANNSTSKSTTFTISSSSCALVKYFSIDGDLANTFVSIIA